MRTYTVTIKGRFENEDGQPDTYKWTKYFVNVPSQEAIVNAFSKLSQLERTPSVLTKYLPLLKAHKDLKFSGNMGAGRPIWPVLPDSRWMTEANMRESCYLSFTYHDTED